MSDSQLHLILRHVRRLADGPTADVPDADLLARFARARDETAFETLLRRHGPMVWGVCARRLRDRHAAEDAFQATFLVLARGARSVRRPESLGCWLHGVALRVAHKLQVRRPPGVPMSTPSDAMTPFDEVSGRELTALLDDELGRLPERLRAPLVLCYLEGRTRDEAAARLGWSLGTFKRRLEQGRAVLRARLERRGVSLPAALLAAGTACVAVPTGLTAATAQAASVYSIGAAAAVGPAVIADAVLQAMAPVRWKWATAVVLLATTFATGAGLLPRLAPTDQAKATRPDDQPPALAAGRVDLYGDPLPPGAIARMGTIRLRHAGPVTALAFAPGGRILASGGEDRTVRCWDLRTGALLRPLVGHDGGVRDVVFTPDGKTLLAAAATRGVLVWAMDADRPPAKLADDLTGATALAMSVDGSILAVACADGAVRVWDYKTGRERPRLPVRHKGEINGLALSPNGRYLVSCGSYESALNGNSPTWLWTLDGTREPLILQADRLSAYRCVAFSPDSRTLIAGGWVLEMEQPNTYFPRGMIDIWDPATATRQKHLEAPKDRYYVAAVTVAPDGQTLVARHIDHELTRWDTTSWTRLGDVATEPIGWRMNQRLALAYAPDGRAIATAGWDGTITVLETATGQPRLPFAQASRGRISSLSYSADGKVLASAGYDRSVRLWDVATGQLRSQFHVPAPVGRMALAPDGRSAVTAVMVAVGQERWVSVWDTVTGRELHRFPNGEGHVSSLTFTPDGGTLAYRRLGRDAAGQKRDTIDLRDTRTGELRAELAAPPFFTRQIHYTADGKTLLAGARDVCVWDAEPPTLRSRFTLRHIPEVVCFSPDGQLVATVPGDEEERKDESSKRAVYVWEVANGQLVREIPMLAGREVFLAFAPDNRHLAVAPAIWRDNTPPLPGENPVQLYEARSGRHVQSFRLPADNVVTAIAFAPDGRSLATAQLDSTVLIWEFRPTVGPPPLR